VLVTDIEISHYSYDPLSARHQANVAMTLKNQVISLFCKLDMPEDEPDRTRATAFVRDAIRQLKRMPEFRSGASQLQFSDNLTYRSA